MNIFNSLSVEDAINIIDSNLNRESALHYLSYVQRHDQREDQYDPLIFKRMHNVMDPLRIGCQMRHTLMDVAKVSDTPEKYLGHASKLGICKTCPKIHETLYTLQQAQSNG